MEGGRDRRLEPPGVDQPDDGGVVDLEGGGHMEAHGPPTRLVGGHWCTGGAGRYGAPPAATRLHYRRVDNLRGRRASLHQPSHTGLSVEEVEQGGLASVYTHVHSALHTLHPYTVH